MAEDVDAIFLSRRQNGFICQCSESAPVVLRDFVRKPIWHELCFTGWRCPPIPPLFPPRSEGGESPSVVRVASEMSTLVTLYDERAVRGSCVQTKPFGWPSVCLDPTSESGPTQLPTRNHFEPQTATRKRWLASALC